MWLKRSGSRSECQSVFVIACSAMSLDCNGYINASLCSKVWWSVLWVCEFTICLPLGQRSISFRLELFPSRQCRKITPREHTIARNVLLRTLHPSKTDQSRDSLPPPSFPFHCSTRSEVCDRLSKVDRYIWHSWCLSKVELYSVEVRTLDWTRGLDYGLDDADYNLDRCADPRWLFPTENHCLGFLRMLQLA